MWPNQPFPVYLAKFTEKIINENFIFCAVKERKKNVLQEAVISMFPLVGAEKVLKNFANVQLY